MFRKRDALGREAFRSYWRDVHAPIALQIPGLQRYEQNHVVAAVDSVPELPQRYPVDGICQLFFEDESAMQGVFTPEMRRALMEDEAKFIQDLRTFVVRQHVVLPVSTGMAAKCISLVTRREGMGPDLFEQQWREDYARRVAGIPGVRSYRQNFVTDRTMDRQPAAYGQLPIDCIDEVWIDDDPSADLPARAVRQIRQEALDLASAMDSRIVHVHAP